MDPMNTKMYVALKAAGVPDNNAQEVADSLAELQTSFKNTQIMLWVNIAFNVGIIGILLSIIF
jgi:hypothetical protein